MCGKALDLKMSKIFGGMSGDAELARRKAGQDLRLETDSALKSSYHSTWRLLNRFGAMLWLHLVPA